MAADKPIGDENPRVIGAEPVYFFDGAAIVPPSGTMPPPRPVGMERTPSPPGTIRGWEYVELEGQAIVPPPGTMPPRPNGRTVRVVLPAAGSAAEVVAELLQRVQTAIDGLSADPANLEALRKAVAALPRAG
jgi:hypothetical protein